MKTVKTALFVISSTDINKCPVPDMPEYAFIGRSNVGKSSLINMLVNRKELARTSGKPGKTRLINHYLIDKSWYLVDLPGYGYASVSKSGKKEFEAFVNDYINNRSNLLSLFLLVDARLPLQPLDKTFMEWLGRNEIPFALVFTKADKLTRPGLSRNIEAYKKEVLENWEELPPVFITSSVKATGKEEILGYISEVNRKFKRPGKNSG